MVCKHSESPRSHSLNGKSRVAHHPHRERTLSTLAGMGIQDSSVNGFARQAAIQLDYEWNDDAPIQPIELVMDGPSPGRRTCASRLVSQGGITRRPRRELRRMK